MDHIDTMFSSDEYIFHDQVEGYHFCYLGRYLGVAVLPCNIISLTDDDQHQPVIVKLAKFGFTIGHRQTIAPVPKNLNPKNITLEKALKLLLSKDVKRCGRPKHQPQVEEAVEAMKSFFDGGSSQAVFYRRNGGILEHIYATRAGLDTVPV